MDEELAGIFLNMTYRELTAFTRELCSTFEALSNDGQGIDFCVVAECLISDAEGALRGEADQ